MARCKTMVLEGLSRELRRQNESVAASLDRLASQLTAACPHGTTAWRQVVAGGDYLRRGNRTRNTRTSPRGRPMA